MMDGGTWFEYTACTLEQAKKEFKDRFGYEPAEVIERRTSKGVVWMCQVYDNYQDIEEQMMKGGDDN
jgi:hypothetical protein